MFFCRGRSDRNCLVAVCSRMRDLIALAHFFSKDAVVHALRFLVDNAVRFHVALQGGTASAPLRVHGPLVVLLRQLQVVHLIGTALPEIQFCSFGLHFVAPSHVWALPFVQRGAVHEKQSPSWQGKATVRPRRQGRRGVAFTGAKRKPLTEGAGGAGAGLARKGKAKGGTRSGKSQGDCETNCTVPDIDHSRVRAFP